MGNELRERFERQLAVLQKMGEEACASSPIEHINLSVSMDSNIVQD